MYLVQIIENGSVMEQYKTTSSTFAECFLETYTQQVELDGGELFYLTKRTASGKKNNGDTFYIFITNVDRCMDVMNSKLMKEENTMTKTNISIYDRIELGDTFHNTNGTDYTILAFNKEADVALLLNPKNKFTPYVGTNGLRDGYWCHGHYFQTIQEACVWYKGML